MVSAMATWANAAYTQQDVAIWAYGRGVLVLVWYLLDSSCVSCIARTRAARKTLSIVAYDLVVRAFSKTVRTPKYESFVNWLPVQTNANTV